MAVPSQHRAHDRVHRLGEPDFDGARRWPVKVCAADLPHVIEQFEGTFDTLWSEPEFEPYSPDDAAQRARLQSALSAETSSSPDAFLVTLHALPFQEVILDKLVAERVIHGRRRNLVVAATGTGKTVIAALDYVRQFAAHAGITALAPPTIVRELDERFSRIGLTSHRPAPRAGAGPSSCSRRASRCARATIRSHRPTAITSSGRSTSTPAGDASARPIRSAPAAPLWAAHRRDSTARVRSRTASIDLDAHPPRASSTSHDRCGSG